MNQRILRVTYQRARQAELAHFSHNVLRRLNEDPAYKSLQPQMEALQERHATYATAVADSLGYGKAKVMAKNLAKTELVRQLNELADALELLANGDPQLILNAGFELASASANYRVPTLSKPVINKARSTGELGEIKVALEYLDGKRVRTYALEYSADQGQTWVNGFYHNRRYFQVHNLPPTRDLLIKVRAIGSNGVTSAWSELVRVAVT